MTTAELLLGKTSATAIAAAMPLDVVDPAREAELVVADLGASTEALIGACVRVRDAVERFRGDREREDAFLGGLVGGRVLPQAEAMLGFSGSPKLCKFRSIGDHATILLRPKLLSLLTNADGYSVIYGVVLVFEAIPGDEEAKVAELVRILSACPGTPSREFLAEAKKDVERRARAATKPAAPSTSTGDSPAPVLADTNINADPKVGPLADLLLLLVTPGPDDWRLLRETYPDERTLSRSLPLHELVGPRAAVIIFGQVRDLATIQTILLPLCGFAGRFPQLLLARRPSGPDVTGAGVIVTAVRGGMRLAAIEDLDLWNGDSIDPIATAARLAPEAVERVHAFAPAKAAGWRCLIGDATWTERPSL
jgi:hypothetical protein